MSTVALLSGCNDSASSPTATTPANSGTTTVSPTPTDSSEANPSTPSPQPLVEV
ncbi:MAG: hypothetical protein HC772_11125, partial [Leptolyngbyaceae cyanobacterium CRU_2_3]|nr:hypothetical protein [Leptolyngbyaceae cyanobacterium CRU_2_3]